MTADDNRANFLSALDRAADDVDLTDFEGSFLESNLDRFNFSDKQRVIIDRMMDKYEQKLGFNPQKAAAVAAQAERAEKTWNRDRSRFVVRAGHPRPGLKPRETKHVTERVQSKNHVLKLEWTPIVKGSVKCGGVPLEAWFIDLNTGLIKAPFVSDGDQVEYDFYPNG